MSKNSKQNSQEPHYPRLIASVKPHMSNLLWAFFAMAMTSLFGSFSIGFVIPFVDIVLAGKPITVPHQDQLPAFVANFIHHLNAMPRWNILNFLIVAVITTSLFRCFFEYLQSYCMNMVSQKVIRDMRNRVYAKIIDMPLRFFNQSQTGALVSRITYDTGVIRDAISEGLTDLLFQPLQLVAYLAALLSIRYVFDVPWQLVIVVMILLPMIIYPVLQVGKRLKKISRAAQEQIADINSTLIESISGIRIVQGFAMEDYEKQRFARQNQGLCSTMMLSIGRMIMVSPLTEFVGFVCFGIVLWLGGREVVENQMSPGAFSAFLFALFSLLRPFKRLSRLHGINQHAMAAAERTFEILDAPNEISDRENATTPTPVKKEISFENISFSYGPKTVLSGVNLKVKVGEIVAIVGPSGSGKTTLVNLLPRFYDPSQGVIRIDGKDLRDLSLRSLRAQIGLVTQDTVLFNDTVSANIAYGRSQTAHRDIEAAARVANAHDFIMKLPQKYETFVGDRGVRLSGGERQRLSIARAVLKNPPILILDEATSALDSESELLVQEAIHNLMKGRTAFVIAHRLSTIRDADRILVVNDGRIVETGTHDELLQKQGVYQRLHDLQFKL